MKAPHHVEEYAKEHALSTHPIVSSGLDGIEQVVVVPVLAERNYLFATLATLARNPADELRRTLILCIVNNRGRHITPQGEAGDNEETMRCLHGLITGSAGAFREECEPVAEMAEIARTSLRLAYIDAASPGREMPDKAGGVGAARKIGMDAALTVLDYARKGPRLIISLDADTHVEENYLGAIRDYFTRGKEAAVVNYSHQVPLVPRERLAILAYELFLRYYVLGLKYAGSPYAFPTIGSTMICTAESYTAVGGMNRRDAAEDFYFLNKLAKYTEVGRITATTVHPSARPSHRVPFGTGRRMIRFLAGNDDEFLLYDPQVFSLLKQWLAVMKSAPERKTEDILTLTADIDPLLLSFLEQHRFSQAWERIRMNSSSRAALFRHFAVWFDGFKTLKLIHFLTDNGVPRVGMFAALEGLLRLIRNDPDTVMRQ